MNIKELAEQAGWSGLYTTYNEPTGEASWEMVKESIAVPVTTKQIELFAELVRQDERELCAKLCDDLAMVVSNNNYIAVDQRKFCAKQIRARRTE